MAQNELSFNQDLRKPANVHYLPGNLFRDDASGVVVSVIVTDDGSPAELSGSVGAKIVRADGTTVTATGGTITGNKASIALPAGAFSVPGLVSVAVKITSSSVVTTIAVVVANVYG